MERQFFCPYRLKEMRYLYSKYGWRFERHNYEKGTFLLGIDFNTSDEWGKDEREFYLSIDLGKMSLVFGKFHYRVDSISKLN
jgi:hypothetical protein